jgi:DNA processing protein
MSAPANACAGCLRRAWLLARLAGHLDQHRDRLEELLPLSDADLIAALGGSRREQVLGEYADFDPQVAERVAGEVNVELLCRCTSRYPPRLRDLPAPPAVLHVAGGGERLMRLLGEPVVAIVGSRQPSPYGTELAASLARGLAAAGVTVISGMARGIDACAQRAALDGGGPTVAVLAGAAELPYPPRARSLHRRILSSGAVVSELPPATRVRRWMFPARNRLLAALSALTVVVEARAGSGALITAAHAAALERMVGAVPGRVGSPLARGPHELLRHGAILVDGPEAVLDHLHLPGLRSRSRPAGDPDLGSEECAVLDALAEGQTIPEALRRAGLDAECGLPLVASLELAGLIRRGPGGDYSVPLGSG